MPSFGQQLFILLGCAIVIGLSFAAKRPIVRFLNTNDILQKSREANTIFGLNRKPSGQTAEPEHKTEPKPKRTVLPRDRENEVAEDPSSPEKQPAAVHAEDECGAVTQPEAAPDLSANGTYDSRWNSEIQKRRPVNTRKPAENLTVAADEPAGETEKPSAEAPAAAEEMPPGKHRRPVPRK